MTTNSEKVPHVHAECIKAWAEGEQIQYRNRRGEWVDCTAYPLWSTLGDYRVKPEPKPDVIAYSSVHNAYSGQKHVYVSNAYNKNSGMAGTNPNLKLTFDGETGKLKSAEAI